jgi:hypothetical protein
MIFAKLIFVLCLVAAPQTPDYRTLAEQALAAPVDADARCRLQIVAGR